MTLGINPPRLYGKIPRGPLRVDWSNGLSAGLVAFWTFDATQGGFIDVAHHKTLTPTGSPTVVPSPAGPALRCNGSTQYVASASNQFLDGNDVVVLVGVTPRGSLVQFAPILMRWDENSALRCWSIVCNSTGGDIRVDIGNGGSDLGNVTSSTGDLAVDRRSVVGFFQQGTAHGTNQAAATAIWVDGVRRANGSVAGNLLTGSNNPVHICHSNLWGSAQRFGQYDIDFVAIWNRYMLPAQLSSLTRDPGQILIASETNFGAPGASPVPLNFGFEPNIPTDLHPNWRSSNKRASGGLSGYNEPIPQFIQTPPPKWFEPEPTYKTGARRRQGVLERGTDPVEPFVFVPPATPKFGFEPEIPRDLHPNWRSSNRRAGALAGGQETLLPPPRVNYLEPQTPHLRPRKRAEGAFAGPELIVKPRVELSATMTAQTAAGASASSPAERELGDVDPLWVAVEVDLLNQITGQPFTLRLGNRGSLQRVVGGVTYQYAPRLQTPVVIGTAISISVDYSSSSNSTPFYQQPLRGQPNNGKITWAVDPEVEEWLGLGTTGNTIIGTEFRAYEGRSNNDVMAFVDDLDLVYTGHVAGFSFDLTGSPPTATMSTTDASSVLDRSLIDDLYPSDFPIVSLQGKPRPRAFGVVLSVDPVLEDQATLTYRVTVPGTLDSVDELRVGGVPWRQAAASGFSPNLTPTLANLLTQFAALPAGLQAQFASVVGADPTNYNNTTGLQNKVNLVALLTGFNGLTAPQQASFATTVSGNTAFYNNTPTGVLNKLGLVGTFYLPAGGTYSVDVANGTVTLGSIPGADVRVDARAVGWATLTTAEFFRQVCTLKGVAFNPAYMAQLDADWGGLVSFYADTNPVNCLSLFDQMAAANVCWWAFGRDGAVIAGVFDAPLYPTDLLFAGSQPGVPLDRNLLPPAGFEARDPVPKEMMTLTPQGLITPAWRCRVGYGKRWSPETSFLGGATDQEKADFTVPELVQDWQAGTTNFQLSPTDGQAITANNPRAQDVYISSLSWRGNEAAAIRDRVVQRIIGNLDHAIWDTTVWMRAVGLSLMQSVQILWVDQNDRIQGLYGGTFRVTSAVMSLGGGPQQIELWGLAGAGSGARLDSVNAPPVVPATVPQSISFAVFPVGVNVAGTVVASVNVTTNTGAPFGGTLGFGPPNNNAGGLVAAGGNGAIGYTVVLSRNLTNSDIGTYNVTVTATQSGTTISNSFSFTVT